jgi:hypothetical protein
MKLLNFGVLSSSSDSLKLLGFHYATNARSLICEDLKKTPMKSFIKVANHEVAG